MVNRDNAQVNRWGSILDVNLCTRNNLLGNTRNELVGVDTLESTKADRLGGGVGCLGEKYQSEEGVFFICSLFCKR